MSVYSKVLDVIAQGQEKERRGTSEKLQTQYQVNVDIANARQQNLRNMMGAMQQFAQIGSQIKEQQRYEEAKVERAQAIEREEVRYLNQQRREQERWMVEEEWRKKQFDASQKAQEFQQQVTLRNLQMSEENHRMVLEQTRGQLEGYKQSPVYSKMIEDLRKQGKTDAEILGAIQSKKATDDAEFSRKQAEEQMKLAKWQTSISQQSLEETKKQNQFARAYQSQKIAQESYAGYMEALKDTTKLSEQPTLVYQPKTEQEKQIADSQSKSYQQFSSLTKDYANNKEALSRMSKALLGYDAGLNPTQEEIRVMADKYKSLPDNDPVKQEIKASFAMSAFANRMPGMGTLTDSDMRMLNQSIPGFDFMNQKSWMELLASNDVSLKGIKEKIFNDVFFKENFEAFVKGQGTSMNKKTAEAVGMFNSNGGFVYNAGTRNDLINLVANNPKDAKEIELLSKKPITELANMLEQKTGHKLELTPEIIKKDMMFLNPERAIEFMPPPPIPQVSGISELDLANQGAYSQAKNLYDNMKKSYEERKQNNELYMSGKKTPESGSKPYPTTRPLEVSPTCGVNGIPCYKNNASNKSDLSYFAGNKEMSMDLYKAFGGR